MEMNFKDRLTFAESIVFINEVVDTVFKTDGSTGRTEYLPELYDYAFRLMIARCYGGYEVTGDVETDYETAMNIHPGELLHAGRIEAEQFKEIEHAISEKISFKKAETNRANITVASRLDAFVPYISELLGTLNRKASEIDMAAFNGFLEQPAMPDGTDETVKSDADSEPTQEERKENAAYGNE